MKKILLFLLISSSCFGGARPVVQFQTYRATELRDVREEQLEKELKKERRRADRLARENAQVNVVNRSNNPRYEIITPAEWTAIKYIAVGFILARLILRK